jgi:hypothetical protein
MLRVCRPGGKIGLANWTPEGFIGSLFKVIGRHLPPPTGLKSPALWGTKDHLVALFGHQATIHAEKRNFTMRYRSDEHWIETFRSYYGPVLKAFEALDASQQQLLHADIKELIAQHNQARDGTMVVASEYLLVVIEKR